MSLQKQLEERSGQQCELCAATHQLTIYEVPPVGAAGFDGSVLVCATCKTQIENPEEVDVNHWRCLNDAIWNQFSPVKIVAWRMLHRLKGEGWPKDLLEMMYLEEADLHFAQASGDHLEESEKVIHRDANGVILEAGDTVVLIKDLKVKGSSMVAKQGTAVRRISLDHENAQYIEGRVSGTQIVIITDYVKKVADKE